MARTPKLGITMGLPLSGKSTWAHEQRDFTTIICPDTYRTALHGQEFVASAEPFVWACVHLSSRALLEDGARVLVDATNVRAAHREPWIKLARDFDLPLEIFLFGADAQTCAFRARAEGRENMVPIIERMVDSWEPMYFTKGGYPVYETISRDEGGITQIFIPPKDRA